jgi:outer membrane beta-barrel protein
MEIQGRTQAVAQDIQAEGSGFLGGWGMRLIWVLVSVAWLAIMAGAWSRNANAATGGAAVSGDDDYSFSWLDKDKKIYVLQNRKFNKAGRILLSVNGGVGSSNPYRDVRYVEPRLALFFSEQLGIEGFYSRISNSSNPTFDALQAKSIMPFVREVNSQTGALVHWVPWYAKINVFNKILYFDWGFEVGGALLDATKKFKLSTDSTLDPVRTASDNQKAFLLGTTQQFFLNQDWSIRLDVLGAFYKATYKAESADETWFSNFQYGLVLGYRL